ncbi:hypothetical protein [Marinomonas sp. TW1]|uniref:hypothetical protein n=1 Tax=Marinomonas sp. TW1 TaxID=1561203 RepID=UPI0007AFA107|nr:hypothetical protein [Marinomonas sp. TW1]KZN12590.1 hypothetical protein OA79_15030 [Marinomonas sp. TW1]
MSNFLRGMGSVLNFFPRTDYMALVPKKGEIHRRATERFSSDFNLAFKKQAEFVDGRAYLKNVKKGIPAQ